MTSADPPRRITVRREYPEKLFYEHVLQEWKTSIEDRNRQYTVAKALDGLKRHPIDVHGYTELRQIYGIGDNIAARLESAWQNFLNQRAGNDSDNDNERPVKVSEIKKIKKGDFLPFLTTAKALGMKERVPFIPRNLQDGGSDADKQPAAKRPRKEPGTGPQAKKAKENPLRPVAAAPPKDTDDVVVIDDDDDQHTVVVAQPVAKQTNTASCSSQNKSDELLIYDPEMCSQSEVILIVDSREMGGMRKARLSIGDHLTKLNVRFETRPLSVGDYLWVVKLPTGEELVLDYVVERKTWDDLKASLYKARFDEQRTRLKQSGIEHVVLVAEGGAAPDRKLEQSLASTAANYKFMIQRTANIEGTAKFLSLLTNRFIHRVKTEYFIGQSFTSLQSGSKKTKQITVADVFLRQLTVCPQMSALKAQAIVAKYPTFRQILHLYRHNQTRPGTEHIDPGLLMSSKVPEINTALSQRLERFFNS